VRYKVFVESRAERGSQQKLEALYFARQVSGSLKTQILEGATL
jgi:hypothetical protein